MARNMSVVSRLIGQSSEKEPSNTGSLVDKMRKDPIFKFGTRVLKSYVSGVSVSTDFDADDPRQKILSSNILSIWDSYILSAVDAIEYGRQALEITYGISKEDPSVNIIAELTPIPWALCRLKVDDGIVLGVEVGKPSEGILLRGGEVWWCAIDASRSNPHGTSIYRGAPWEVYQRREAMRKNRKAFTERFSIGGGVATVPIDLPSTSITDKGASPEIDANGDPVDTVQAMGEQLQSLKSGGWIVIPSANYSADKGGGRQYTIEAFPEPKSSDPLDKEKEALDVEAIWSLGIPERAIMQQGQTGAYALADAHQKVLHDRVNEIVRQVITSFQRQVVAPLCELNRMSNVIEMTWQRVGDAQSERVNKLIDTAISQPTPNPLLTKVIDIVSLIEGEGIPLQDNAREALALLSTQAGPASPGMAFSIIEDIMQSSGEAVKRLGAIDG
ncbi:MAG: hypothetical protein EB060_10270 [Proteobacteria bacterium]|nr:hypothetical protein [Pseudomonadota bacterium]